MRQFESEVSVEVEVVDAVDVAEDVVEAVDAVVDIVEAAVCSELEQQAR